MTKRTAILTFFSGFEAFHALVHFYLAFSKKTELKGHPAELIGIDVTPRFHLGAAVFNTGLALGLGKWAWKSYHSVALAHPSDAKAKLTA